MLAVFLRSENTEKSIVRALLLEQTPEQWNVALLYQFPEAAADSSDAAASVQLCAGTGETLEQALFAAEEHLPQRPSYRLCEYLFLNTGSLRGSFLPVSRSFVNGRTSGWPPGCWR